MEDLCKKIKKSLAEGINLRKSLVDICKSVNENVQVAVTPLFFKSMRPWLC